MSVDITHFLGHADAALKLFADLQGHDDQLATLPPENLVEASSRIAAAIDSIAPPDHRYRKLCAVTLKDFGPADANTVRTLVGILRALRADAEAGFLKRHEEVVRAEVFGDFLEMSDHLVSTGFKDPAATMAGGVLEEHLRKICMKHAIPLNDNGRARPASRLINELAKGGVINSLEQKQLVTLTDLRNKAAHGKYGEYSEQNVRLMIESIRLFIIKFSA